MRLKEYQKFVLGVIVIFATLGLMSLLWNKTKNIPLTVGGMAAGGTLLYFITRGDGSHRKVG